MVVLFFLEKALGGAQFFKCTCKEIATHHMHKIFYYRYVYLEARKAREGQLKAGMAGNEHSPLAPCAENIGIRMLLCSMCDAGERGCYNLTMSQRLMD